MEWVVGQSSYKYPRVLEDKVQDAQLHPNFREKNGFFYMAYDMFGTD